MTKRKKRGYLPSSSTIQINKTPHHRRTLPAIRRTRPPSTRTLRRRKPIILIKCLLFRARKCSRKRRKRRRSCPR
ncbi:unnamed protein product [Zymoseptoria tritici ST99CH_3D7]|uniref:Uncharacterized protein n=1 Tax=Zymoseptoria tritici (strain ST99CH_3D7) TaxID=1276538 RepID=A0A1X7RLM8_ZYMT9|nr:unnamed protein product [Zymoseptoria tritici ST99CH_3D7]